MSGKLYIMCGLPRSGKSSWIKKYQRAEKYVVISNDWIRENIFHNKYAFSINPSVWMITDSCIRILLSQDKSVIFDGINHTKFVREQFIKIAREMDATVKIIYMDTPLEVCLERNDKLPEKTLKRMAEEFEEPTLDECDGIITEIF